MSFYNLKEWTTPRGKVKELAINGKIAWKSHTHSYTMRVTAPTCTAQGYTTYTCSCGDSYVSDYKAAAGHKYGTAYLSSEFYTGYGQKCSVCGHLKAMRNPYIYALSVGSSVFMNVNGVKTEFIVVHQGLPDDTLYDESCDGAWLLMKDLYVTQAWDSSNAKYQYSDIHTYLNGTFLGLLDSNIQSTIKQVKIPYRGSTGTAGSVSSGASGLSTKIFLLSGCELGWTTNSTNYFPVDGACLDYFSGCSDTDSERIGYYGGTATQWWLRSPRTNGSSLIWSVSEAGALVSCYYYFSLGVRPALILPSETLVDGSGNVIA